MKKILLLLIILFISVPVQNGNVIIVHPSGFDGSEKIKDFVEKQVSNEDNVIWLAVDENSTWPYKFSWDKKIEAPGGYLKDKEINFDEAVFCGGYYRACFQNSIVCLQDKLTTITIETKGVYYSSSRTLEEQIVENDLSDTETINLIYGITDKNKIILKR